MHPIVQTLLSGLTAAIVIDVGSFISARQKDRSASFDFGLCFARCVYGIAVGSGMGAGIQAAGG